LKKITMVICFCLLFAMIPAPVINTMTPPPIRVILDDETLVFDVFPIVVNGRVMVPMRGIFEALGAEVEWDYDSRTITASKDDLVIIAVVGSLNIQIGDRFMTMEIAPMIASGRTLVPIRFVTEAFGADVLWDEVKRTVHIRSAQINEDTTPTPAQEPVVLHRGRLMVLYHANGGIGAPISNTVTINEDGSVRFRHPRTEPRKEGYTFIGWLFENDGSFRIDRPGGTVWVLDLDISRNETITYFAQWERDE